MSGDTPIAVRDNPERSRFEGELDGHIATIDYNRTTGRMIVAHTEVPGPIEGRGVASRMFAHVVEMARTDGLVLVPVCPVFALWLRRHAEAHDVIDPGFRRSLGLDPAG